METSNQDRSNLSRVLMVAPTPFFADRGCHVRILEEVRILKALGHQVAVCTYHNGRDISGVEIHRITRIPWYSKLSAGPSIHKFYLDLILLWTVIRACVKHKPDIIHAHLHEGIIIGKIASFLFRVPLVADLQGRLADELVQHHFIKPQGVFFRVYQWVDSILTRSSDAVLISSPGALNNSANELQHAKVKIEIITDGVDTENFHPDEPLTNLRDELEVPRGVRVVGFLGVLTEYQGVSVLLEAIPHVVKETKQVHFLIMGYPDVEFYREKAETLGVADYVTFTGRVAYEDAPRYLAVCDVAVSPKFATTEANGKLLNYMALGLPIVATDTPVNRQLLGDLGVYAEVGNSTSLAEALLQVLLNEAYARSLGTKLREVAIVEHSWRSRGERIVEVYQDVKREVNSTQTQIMVRKGS